MKIATWNINSINARLPALITYLDKEAPDFLCLQEIKCQDENFPLLDIKSSGYNALFAGQKSYNGVALLAKETLANPLFSLPNAPDGGEQARFVSGVTQAGIRIISVYVPNGNPPLKDPTNTEKLKYKLAWFDALHRYLKELADKPFIIGGDFNVIINDGDVYNPEAYRTNALMLPEVREKLAGMVKDLELTNVFKTLHPEAGNYSFWDYTMGAWQRNMGMLIDDIFLSPMLAERLKSAEVHKYMRGMDKASDHAPLIVELT